MKNTSSQQLDKYCPKCKSLRLDKSLECPHCGVIYHKYQSYKTRRKTFGSSHETASNYKELLFHPGRKINTATTYGHTLILCIIGIYTFPLIFSGIASNYAGEAFIHLINIPFHEFGHLLFRPLGRFMTSLGGSITQLLIPAVCVYVFLFKYQNTFGAAVSLWWFGENFIDMAPYINDARSLTLPLLGGNTGMNTPYGFHDWQYILTETGLKSWDHSLAKFSHIIGAIVMITALAWATRILFLQYKFAKSC